VTGAAGGIGHASAVRFAAEGASVVICDLESQREAAEETVAMIEAEGGRAMFVAADVTVDADQKRLVDPVVSAFGRLDFAHNDAGLGPVATLEETTEEAWDSCIAVNMKGVFLGMKHQVAQMRKQGSGAQSSIRRRPQVCLRRRGSPHTSRASSGSWVSRRLQRSRWAMQTSASTASVWRRIPRR
jgi:NAD(P)-dependent dehydrogenase (short-subunit alcohol dehydrogenase family)